MATSVSTGSAPAEPQLRNTVMRRFTEACVRYVERLMPDPFLFAIVLTLVVVGLVLWFVPGATGSGIVNAWYGGVWGANNIFTFAMQMILILVGGYTLAEAPVVKRGLAWLAAKPRNQLEAGLLCFFAAAAACLLNWGLGLVVGALLARQIGGRLRGMHFGYVVAAGYMGYMVWTNGLSSSIALANTDRTSKLNIIFTQTNQVVPLSQTIFQPYSWLPVLATLVAIPLLLWRMQPRLPRDVDPAVFDVDVASPVDGDEPARRRTPAERLENLWIINVVIFVAGMWYFHLSHYALNISSMVMLFLALGALLHWTPLRFIRAFQNAAKASGPLLLQYPFYGGIVALLAYSPAKGTRPLQDVIAAGFVASANLNTLPFFNYLGSVVISLFVPSGGGHWGVQGPVAVSAATGLGGTSPLYLGKISMSVAFGEAVANMIQPFWLLPVLAIAKLSIREVMGFTVVAFLVGFVIFGIAALAMPFL